MCGKGSDAVYGFGLFGALYFYLSNSSTFAEGAMGILKSFVWPAILVFKALTMFN